MFQAIYIDKQGDDYQCSLKTLQDQDFPEHGDVTVRVEYSTLNFKDGLAITGSSPVVRTFPLVPGIDFSGVVESSRNPDFSAGQRVFINGWGLGEKYWGGLAQKAKVPGEWLLSVPQTLSTYDVMAIGTAGYTAMLAVMALEKHGVLPESGPVLVTGANGGVGGFAIAFLAKLGYQVVASTGRPEETERLHKLGASEIIDRQSLSQPGKPLAKERWAGAIDSVGSHTLANVCASTVYGGVVAACGLAQGMDFPATVAPFILRGVTLAGIDSVMCPMETRRLAWEKIAGLIDSDLIAQASTTIGMSDVIETAQSLLEGKVKGRVVVDVNQE
ncbi:acrylyl-CoA reductase (NADPH) [Vibrio mangrovi]|uniref:Acrylyl-CoA reductase AcuI n=1 Tax=Vibrio mangrovi TaxID=474394 RepID=A0A1Y6IVQ3_9VIBR|nr:MDR family oxidoreductase [Vibrio mangrovi]MDW6001840.1 MDR family oxidoreductase [Vibrio mangrovi]SMS00133.1 Acrylyl-CoA reductase AcuI [Vibrio mangrovi]